MTPLQIVLLVVGLLLVQLLILIPLLLLVRRKTERLMAAMRDQLVAQGERIALGPEAALYRGANERYSRVKGNGVVALTDRRIVIHKLIGDPIEVALDAIRGVREDKWFLSAYTSGRLHVIVQLDGGIEVGFITAPARHGEWMAAIRAVAKPAN
jgi:hypothetical protein